MKTPAQQNYDLYQTLATGRPAQVIPKQEGLSGLEIAGIVGGSLALLGAGAYAAYDGYEKHKAGSFGSVVTNGYDKDENPFQASARRQTSDQQIANAPPKAQRLLGNTIQMESISPYSKQPASPSFYKPSHAADFNIYDYTGRTTKYK